AQKIADRIVSASKHTVEEMWRHGVIDRFDPRDDGHAATQYERWFNVSQQYDVEYANRYEPWVIVDRLTAPWHDARFRGYGQNKIVHLEHMNATGFRLVVHPSAWLVHRKHHLAPAKLQHVRDNIRQEEDAAAAAAAEARGGGGGGASGRHSTLRGHSNGLGNEIRAQLANGTYRTGVDTATRACAHWLPWWQQSHWQWQAQAQGQRLEGFLGERF
ncbi:hypothetical protein FOA52_008237, partial [Chlamydomonas sp. UWO 241]